MSEADEQLSVTGSEPHPFTSTRRQATRDRLLEAAIDAFREEGLQGASVEAICTRAGFTRGAFYSNFESKEQLFLALLEREFARRIVHLKTQAATLEPELRARSCSLNTEEVAGFIVDFFMPESDASTWIVLETEFLLLSMRDPSIAHGYLDFMQRFYTEIAEAVTHVIGVAGRQFTVPAAHAIPLLSSIYERELQTSALLGTGKGPTFDTLGERLAELLFAITTSIPEAG